MSEFNWGPVDKTLHHFVFFFRYSQDEASLIVSSVGHTSLKVEGSDWPPLSSPSRVASARRHPSPRRVGRSSSARAAQCSSFAAPPGAE
jgi:hypothetical protein